MISYRLAEEKDIKELRELRKRQLIDEGLKPDIDIDGPLDTFFREMFRGRQITQWIAEEDGRIIATAAIIYYYFPPSFSNRSGVRGYITNVFTDAEYRGRGLSTALLKKLLAEAHEKKVKLLFLGASKMGRSVYKGVGFSESDVWMEYRFEDLV